MIDQLMDSYRRASASWLQMQQNTFRQLAEQWLATPSSAAAASTDFSRSFQKRWLELTIDALNKQRESLDSIYTSGIQIIDQTFRASEAEARSTQDYQKLVEEMWRKLFDNFKSQSEAQMRDFQEWAEKSVAWVREQQNLQQSPQA